MSEYTAVKSKVFNLGPNVFLFAIYKSQKIYSPQIANPQIATFAEAPHFFKRIEVRKIADLVFADRPPWN
jgi:hypothetical protein